MSFSVRLGFFIVAAVAWPSAALAQRPPAKALKALKVADEMEVSLFASEPMITNPSAIDIDTQGRVWVAEIQWYRARAKQPPADQIKVLEDTDGDGKADKATVFAEGLFAPMSVCVAGDKVYVATSPDLWVYEDKDGDLKADGPPKKLLTGFGGFNHDHGAHSLVLGPDHKWWMSHGDTGFDVRGTDSSHIKFQWGAMLRGELDGSKLEVIAKNFRNPYEICVSSFGESFVSDNDNDGNFSVRICWIMEGGDYGWFGRPPAKVPPGTPFGEHWHFRGHIPGFVPATLVTGFGSPCGMCFYEGDAFGEKYKNAPLHTDNGPREVRIYRHTPKGFGMTATSEVFMTSQGDNYFRPDDICAAPDGSLYVSDWYDGGVGGHAYNDPDRGRIYRLTPKDKKLARHEKPGPYATVADAIEGLQSVNLATQYLARERLLAEGEKSIAALKKLVDSDEPNFKARALWVLDRIGGKARDEVVGQLLSTDDSLRSLAVRILVRHGDEYAETILKLADDASPLVGREVLLAIRDIEGLRALDVLTKFAEQYDGEDRYLLEAINIAAGDRKVQLYERLAKAESFSPSRFRLLQLLNPKAAATSLAEQLTKSGVEESTQKLLLTEAGSVASPEAGRGLLKLLADEKTSTAVKQMALEKLAANLSGNWKTLADDPQLAAVMRKLLAQSEMRGAVLAIVAGGNLTKLADDVAALASNVMAPESIRVKAIQTAAQLNATSFADRVRALVNDKSPAIRGAAIGALVHLQDMKAVRELLTSERLSPEELAMTADRLLINPAGAMVLLKMIDDRQLPAERAISRAAHHPDSNVRTLFAKHLPQDQRPQRLGDAIKPEELLRLTGRADRGRRIFHNSTAAQCKTCHTTDGKGGLLGPDLSAIGKKYERATLLETILEPSRAIAPEYVTYLVETEDGRVFMGVLQSKDDQAVILKDALSKSIRIPQDNIASITEQRISLMPELVLKDVTAQDAADLLAYMMTLQAGQPEEK
ncbi:MAG: PVC-type heme-binding CxxCH protein [Pirellulales bacterium]